MTVFKSNEEMAPKTENSDRNAMKYIESEADPDPDDSRLNIPGIKNVWDSKYTLIGKLVWMLIIVACTIMVLIHVSNRIQFYLSQPVSVSVQIQQNQTMTLPDVTVCNTVYFDVNAYMEVRKDIANISGLDLANVFINEMLQYMSIMDLWERVSFHLEDLISACSIEKKLCADVGEWRPTISVMGICYTYRLQKPLNVSGRLHGMKIILNALSRTSSWKVLLHSPHDSPKAKLFTEGISISSNITMDIQVQLRQLSLKSTDSKACSETIADDCDVKCLSDLTLEKFQCRLPFMEDVDAPYCSPPSHSIAESLVKQVLLGQEKGCACLPECILDGYETNVDSTYYPDRNITQVRIFYENFQFTKIVEELSYGFVPLLSDIGGTLGLFLGFSILTIAEIIARLLIKLKHSWQYKKQKKKKSLQQNSSKKLVQEDRPKP